MVIYLASTFVLFALGSWIFYHATKRNMIHQQQMSLQIEAKHLHGVIRALHISDAPVLYYPKATQTRSAIFDIDRHYIFGNFPTPISLDTPPSVGWLRLIVPIDSYYLGAAFLMLARPVDMAPMEALLRNIVLFMLLGGVVFAVMGYFLGRLFIAPMRQSVEAKNRFIEDTTHELNTPISTILANIEMIETLEKATDAREELSRITIASRTLSRIYDDLTYLSLSHPYHRRIESLNMGALVQERIEYFSMMAEAKHLAIHPAIADEVMLQMDANDAMRLIDNLLSNAIKYNRRGGTIRVALDAGQLTIEDTGIGIDPEALPIIFERYARFNESEGGFGIGLSIVKRIVDHYGILVTVESQQSQGTTMILQWKTNQEVA
jgi:two-component system OmpR family sensor kinase